MSLVPIHPPGNTVFCHRESWIIDRGRGFPSHHIGSELGYLSLIDRLIFTFRAIWMVISSVKIKVPVFSKSGNVMKDSSSSADFLPTDTSQNATPIESSSSKSTFCVQ